MELTFDKYQMLVGDCLRTLKEIPDKSIQVCVTSPPYFNLRVYDENAVVPKDNCPDWVIKKISELTKLQNGCFSKSDLTEEIYDYFKPAEIGLEQSPEEYVQKLVQVFDEVKRVLKDDGTLWLNLGDTYSGTKYGNTNTSKNNLNTQHADLKKSMLYEVKNKDLIGIPWMVAFALRSSGWYLRQDIIFNKVNTLPESVTDRCTKSHEYVFLLSKNPNYYFDYEAIQEEATAYDGRKDTLLKGSPKYQGQNIMPGMHEQSLASGKHERWKFKKIQTGIKIGGNKYGDSKDPHYQTYSGNDWEQRVITDGETIVPIRNKRDVWNIVIGGYKEAHFATYPEKLVEPCILAGSKPGDIVLDPFNGSGTTGVVAMKYGRRYIGCELNPKYVELTEQRFASIFEGSTFEKTDDDKIIKYSKESLF